MRVFSGLVALMLAGMSSLQAGVETDPELVFASGFEGFDCQAFDGLGDTISIPTITIAGDFSLNGGNFPQLEQDDANFSLRDRITGDVFIIGNSHDQNFSVNIIPGRYDVMYSVESGGPTVPRNEGAMLMENVPLLESGILDISVTAYMVSGDFTLNGEGFPASEYDDAELFLDGSSTGRLKLGESKDLSFSNIPVLTGEYDIRYKLESPGGTVPWNEWGLVGQVVVTGNNANMDVDVQSVK